MTLPAERGYEEIEFSHRIRHIGAVAREMDDLL